VHAHRSELRLPRCAVCHTHRGRSSGGNGPKAASAPPQA
jgi:mono/diheme cytochrome c family protein